MNNIIPYTVTVISLLLIFFSTISYLIEKKKEIENEENHKNFIDELKHIGYFHKTSNSLNALFGTNDRYRFIDVSLQLANNFKTYKRFDYLVKYFGLVINDETLNNLNNFYKITKRAEQIEKSNELYTGFLQEYMPEFVMEYTSAQGRSYMRTSFLFSSSNIMWLSLQVQTLLEKRNTRKIQRNLLTPQLRDAILRRDNWTCQNCGNSVFNEPNLLLEVDHIIPISKGGKTEPNNLQTLCWRCNRQKSDNI